MLAEGVLTRRLPLSAPLLRCLRPKQWVKNLFLFAGILFTLDRPHPVGDWLCVGTGFLLFCFLSGAVYLFNDIADRERDRLHPQKCRRPIASGQVSVGEAVVVGLLLAVGSVFASFSVSWFFGLTASAYFLLTLAYTFCLKHVIIIDVLTIAAGFVLRAVAGAVAVDVEMSAWLLVCTTLLALLLGLAKRRAERTALQEDACKHRGILAEYTPELLDQWITILTSATLMAYALYTFNSPTARGHHYLMATIPFVLYGIFRYLYLVNRRNVGGSPANELLADRPLLATIALWGLASALIMRLG
jgi:4-hydroxybenzoate polyprenyltransferase